MEPCPRCSWQQWESAVWFATCFVSFLLLFTIFLASLPPVPAGCVVIRTGGLNCTKEKNMASKVKGVWNMGNQTAKSTPKVVARPNTTSKTPAHQKVNRNVGGNAPRY